MMRRRRVVLITALLAILGVGSTATSAAPVDAAWIDSEHAAGAFTADVMRRATNLECSSRLLSVTFSWANPVDDNRRSWSYSLTRLLAPPLTGTIGRDATNQTFPTLLEVGQTFTLWANGPGNWVSPNVQARVTTVVLGAVTCAVSPSP